MIHHWKGFDSEITDFNYHLIRHNQVKLYHWKPQTLKHVKN